MRDLLRISRTSAPATAVQALFVAGFVIAYLASADTMRWMDKPHPLFSRATEPSCPNCGFALNGLPDSGACPECGRLYTPTSSVAFEPPSLGRALGYLALPLAPAALGIAVGIDVTANNNGSEGAVAFGLAWAIAGILCVIWSSVRTTRFLRALADTRPPKQEGAPFTASLSRAATAVAILVTTFASLVFVLLSLAFAACLIISLFP